MISKGLIYFIGLIDNLEVLSSVLFIFGIVGAVTLGLIISINMEDIKYDRYSEESYHLPIKKKWLKISIIILIVSALGMTFIPSKETTTLMIVSDLATKENYEYTKEELKGLIDYAVEKVNEVNK